MHQQMLSQVARLLCGIVALVASVRPQGRMTPLHMGLDRRRRRARHVAQRALVLVHVMPHVVAQKALGTEAATAVDATVARLFVLARKVVQQFRARREHAAAVRACQLFLLRVRTNVLRQFVHRSKGGLTGTPTANAGQLRRRPRSAARLLGVAADVHVESFRIFEAVIATCPLALVLLGSFGDNVARALVHEAAHSLRILSVQKVLAVTLNFTMKSMIKHMRA